MIDLKTKLAALASRADQVQLVYVSPDLREGHFMFVHPYDGQYYKNSRAWGVLGIRFTKFSDGEHALSWCSKCPCGDCFGRHYMQHVDCPNTSCASFLETVNQCAWQLVLCLNIMTITILAGYVSTTRTSMKLSTLSLMTTAYLSLTTAPFLSLSAQLFMACEAITLGKFLLFALQQSLVLGASYATLQGRS